jgi:mannosyltransferase OCH1-like enzyme
VWNEKYDQNVTEKWREMLTHFTMENIHAVNMKCLISSCLALPGFNAPIECVFSMINALWPHKKTDLKQKQ